MADVFPFAGTRFNSKEHGLKLGNILSPPAEVVTTLDAWFDRIAGAVHAFGGEVLKFIGDGILAIFPIGERDGSAACDAALRAVEAAR